MEKRQKGFEMITQIRPFMAKNIAPCRDYKNHNTLTNSNVGNLQKDTVCFGSKEAILGNLLTDVAKQENVALRGQKFATLSKLEKAELIKYVGRIVRYPQEHTPQKLMETLAAIPSLTGVQEDQDADASVVKDIGQKAAQDSFLGCISDITVEGSRVAKRVFFFSQLQKGQVYDLTPLNDGWHHDFKKLYVNALIGKDEKVPQPDVSPQKMTEVLGSLTNIPLIGLYADFLQKNKQAIDRVLNPREYIVNRHTTAKNYVETASSAGGMRSKEDQSNYELALDRCKKEFGTLKTYLWVTSGHNSETEKLSVEQLKIPVYKEPEGDHYNGEYMQYG